MSGTPSSAAVWMERLVFASAAFSILASCSSGVPAFNMAVVVFAHFALKGKDPRDLMMLLAILGGSLIADIVWCSIFGNQIVQIIDMMSQSSTSNPFATVYNTEMFAMVMVILNMFVKTAMLWFGYTFRQECISDAETVATTAPGVRAAAGHGAGAVPGAPVPGSAEGGAPAGYPGAGYPSAGYPGAGYSATVAAPGMPTYDAGAGKAGDMSGKV